MKILLIDDDPYWSKGFREYAALFESWNVIYASSPREGIELLERNVGSLDAVLVDIMMLADDSVPEARARYGMDTGLFLLDRLIPIVAGRIPLILLSARQDVSGSAYEGKAQCLIQKNLATKQVIEEVAIAIGC